VNTNNCVRISGQRGLFQFVERLSKNRQTDIHGITNCVYEKPRLIHFFRYCGIHFIQLFMLYTAVYQQQETRPVSHVAFCRMGTVSLSWGHFGSWVALVIHETLAQRLKKE